MSPISLWLRLLLSVILLVKFFQSVGLSSIGAPGSTAVLAMLNDAVKKGGVFASSQVGGLSGAFIPVSEDAAIAAAASSGKLTLEKLRGYDLRMLRWSRHDCYSGFNTG